MFSTVWCPCWKWNCVCNKMLETKAVVDVSKLFCTDDAARCWNGSKEHCGMNMSSLCEHWRDRWGYLASISRTALGASCGGANDWASRAEPLPASAVSEHACRENRVQGEVRNSIAVQSTLTRTTFIGTSMWYNEAFRCCSTLLRGKHWKVFFGSLLFLHALFHVFHIYVMVCGLS